MLGSLLDTNLSSIPSEIHVAKRTIPLIARSGMSISILASWAEKHTWLSVRASVPEGP